jgi:biotin transport system substrate-specific component
LAQTAVASTVFLPGDILKSVVATLITVALWRAYPRAFGSAHSTNPSKTDQPADSTINDEAAR